MHVRQKENQILRSHGTFEDREAKLEQVSLRRSRDETKSRVVVATGRFKKERCLANQPPSAGAIRRKGKATFVR